MQFAAQARHYEASYPGAQYSVVLVDGRPAGRIIIERSGREIVIVDIALLAGSRHAGVGSAVVQGLLDEADAGGLPVRCHVLQGNEAAQRFWARHGFVPQGVDGGHVAMVRANEPVQAR
jgi:ribosomal protein S18 acetylase RimI-like enzyme